LLVKKIIMQTRWICFNIPLFILKSENIGLEIVSHLLAKNLLQCRKVLIYSHAAFNFTNKLVTPEIEEYEKLMVQQVFEKTKCARILQNKESLKESAFITAADSEMWYSFQFPSQDNWDCIWTRTFQKRKKLFMRLKLIEKNIY
jgi:hypothetical protein